MGGLRCRKGIAGYASSGLRGVRVNSVHHDLVLMVRLQKIYDRIASTISEWKVAPPEVQELKEENRRREVELDEIEAEQADIQGSIPNMSHPSAPVGEDDKSNLELRKGKTPVPQFDFDIPTEFFSQKNMRNLRI